MTMKYIFRHIFFCTAFCIFLTFVFIDGNEAHATAKVDALLQQFEQAEGRQQKSIAQHLFRLLEKEEFLDEPFAIPSQWPVDSIRAEVWLTAGQYYFYNQDFKRSIYYSNLALQKLQEGKNTEKLADCMSYLSVAYTRISDYANAISYAKEVLAIDRKTGDRSNISSSLSNIAGIYLSSKRPAEAKPYILEAIENSTVAKDSTRMAIQMGIASEIFQNLGENSKALSYAKNAYELEKRRDRMEKAAIRLCQMAAVQIEMGMLGDARANLLQALPELEKSGNRQSYSIACNQLGSIALKKGDLREARDYYTRALSFFMQSGDYFNESKTRQGLYLALKESNPREAMENLERFSVLKDSIYHKEMQQAMSEYDAQYKNESLKDRNALLQESLAYEKRMKSTIIWTAAAILLLATIAILLLVKLTRLRKQRNDLLRESERSRTNFFTNITHEFRTPLTVIRGAANDASRFAAENPELQDDIETIKRHEQALLNLINQLLDISKLSSGHAEAPAFRHGEVTGFIRMICESCALYGADRNVAVEYDSDPATIEMDFIPDYMERIVQNLLSNSIKFSNPDSVVKVATSIDGGDLLLTVHDDGIGMTTEQREKIFEPFYQVEGRNRNLGTGVGLSLVSLSVKGMKGNVEVDSKPGKGSTFTVRIPLKSDAVVEGTLKPTDYQMNTVDEEVAVTAISDTRDNDSDEGVRILIVEDTPDVAKYIKKQLNPEYRYYFAANGHEGLKKAETLVPDVIITDVMMPEMDGFELTKHIRGSELLNHIPVIIVTAKASHEDRMRGLEAGADAYLEKPFHADELDIRVEKLLEQRRLLQQKFMATLPASSGISEPSDGLKRSEDSAISDRDREFYEKFTGLVNAQMTEGKISYGDLASDMFLCRAQLGRKLKAITGMTLTELVLDIRIARAKELLLTTDLQIAGIAMQCGIDNPPYFSQIFRKATGLTPQQFRMQNS